MQQPARTRLASTVVLVRDAASHDEMQVLLLKRADSKDQTAGAWVFPGGVVDDADRDAGNVLEMSDADASARLEIAQGGIAFYAAAIRECFEECGILLAGASRLSYIGHWLTPQGRPKRFDTRFFLAPMPKDQVVVVDGREILAHAWVSPADALAGPFAQHLMTPARATLQALEPLRSVGEALSWAAGLTKITCMQPRLAMAGTGLCSIAPGHPAFDEVAKLDPEGVGNAWCEFKAGEPVRIGTRTERITDTAGSNRYRVQMDDGRWVDVPVDATHVVGADRIVIAPGRSTLAVELRECADWLAPERGFLARIGR